MASIGPRIPSREGPTAGIYAQTYGLMYRFARWLRGSGPERNAAAFMALLQTNNLTVMLIAFRLWTGASGSEAIDAIGAAFVVTVLYWLNTRYVIATDLVASCASQHTPTRAGWCYVIASASSFATVLILLAARR